MAKFATGKYAKAISDRSGMEFPYKEMVKEWNGSLVHISEFEPKQPQIRRRRTSADAIALQDVRPQRFQQPTNRRWYTSRFWWSVCWCSKFNFTWRLCFFNTRQIQR